MTVMIEPDVRGIDALSGEVDDSVAQGSTPIFDALLAEMIGEGCLAWAPPTGDELAFDDEPWRTLPPIEDLEYLWAASPPLVQMLHRLAATAAGGRFDDLPRYMAAQRALADMELELKRGAADAAAAADGTVDGGSAGHGPVCAFKGGSGGVPVSGGPENGDKVGGGGKAAQQKNARKSSKVPRGRGAGAAEA